MNGHVFCHQCGQVIGDFFGTFGIGSVGGFLGNFFYGLLGYKVWAHMGLASSEEDLLIDSWKKTANFIIIAILSSCACSMIIAWWLEVVKLLPFAAVGPIILVNNTAFSLVIGVPLMRLLYGRLNRWDLVWFAIMDEADRPRGRSPKAGTALIWIGVLGGFAVGLAVSIGATGIIPFVGGEGAAAPSVALGVTPFIFIMVIGCLLI